MLSWVAWVGIWEVRVQFLRLLPTCWVSPSSLLKLLSVSSSAKQRGKVTVKVSSHSNILSF